MKVMRDLIVIVAVGFGAQAPRANHMLDVLTYDFRVPPGRLSQPVLPAEPGRLPAYIDTTGFTITLLSMDRDSYSLGDPIVYEVLIRNSSQRPIVLPWSPNPELFASELLTTRLSRAGIFLEVRDGRSQRIAWLESLSLLGSETDLGSLETIGPGETAWLRIPGRWRTNTEADRTALIEHSPGDLRVGAVLFFGANLIRSSNHLVASVQTRTPR